MTHLHPTTIQNLILFSNSDILSTKQYIFTSTYSRWTICSCQNCSTSNKSSFCHVYSVQLFQNWEQFMFY